MLFSIPTSCTPLSGANVVPLVLEYEEVLLREANALNVTPREVRIVIAAVVQGAERHAVHFRWPEYVRDPDDAHVLDTAVHT